MILAQGNLPVDGTLTGLYSCPATPLPNGSQAIVTVELCNGGDSQARVSLTLIGGVETAIEWMVPLPPAGTLGGSTLIRTGVALGPNQHIRASALGGSVQYVVYGVQEAR